MDVIIVCHTEFGFVKDKRVIFDRSTFQGVTTGIGNLLKLADTFGAKITFAVMPEVAEFVPKNTGHEIGLHVHPDDIFIKETCGFQKDSLYLSDYSFEEQYRMIACGKEKVGSALGVVPKVFVGGRWAFNDNTAKALIQNGFTHDCSAMPQSRGSRHWKRLLRITMPYHPNSEDYQLKGSLPLFIVPVSQGLLGASANPEEARAFGLPWLKACFEEYYSRKAPVFHIALHSPTMTDSFYINIMESFLSFIASHKDIHFRFVSEIHEYPEKKILPNALAYLKGLNGTILKSVLLR